MMHDKIVKKDFDFGWKTWIEPHMAELALRCNRGDLLDIGCGTCKLFEYLRSRGWKGKYYGIDIKKYEGYRYPKGVELIIEDALEVEFPRVDTVLLYNILENVDNPIILLRKAIRAARKNVLINVPKRNEEMWRYGVVEYHQLDKTHKHCGFSKEEVYKLVGLAGGKIKTYEELGKTNATIGIGLWNNIIPKRIVYLLGKIFSSKTFLQEIWCEVVKNYLLGEKGNRL
jgi:SAM-dependent methyltransferase